MVEQLCPVCGCSVSDDAYEKGGAAYCCEPCATVSVCECDCCEVVKEKPEEEK